MGGSKMKLPVILRRELRRDRGPSDLLAQENHVSEGTEHGHAEAIDLQPSFEVVSELVAEVIERWAICSNTCSRLEDLAGQPI
jgi:hypothetical protein